MPTLSNYALEALFLLAVTTFFKLLILRLTYVGVYHELLSFYARLSGTAYTWRARKPSATPTIAPPATTYPIISHGVSSFPGGYRRHDKSLQRTRPAKQTHRDVKARLATCGTGGAKTKQTCIYMLPKNLGKPKKEEEVKKTLGEPNRA